MHIETIGFQATAPGSSGGTAAAFSGDSASVRNAREGSRIRLIAGWGKNQTAGWWQFIAPSMPDTQRGIRVDNPVAPSHLFIPPGVQHALAKVDTFAVTVAGSATAGDIEQACLTLWYEDTPGLAAQLRTYQQVLAAAGSLITVSATLTLGSSGGWSGSEAINAESDLLRADRTYAVLGMTSNTDICALGIQGPDWANVRLAVPACRPLGTRPERHFVDLSRMTGLPTIPIMEGTNRGSVLLTGAADENGGSPLVTVYLLEQSQ